MNTIAFSALLCMCSKMETNNVCIKSAINSIKHDLPKEHAPAHPTITLYNRKLKSKKKHAKLVVN